MQLKMFIVGIVLLIISCFLPVIAATVIYNLDRFFEGPITVTTFLLWSVSMTASIACISYPWEDNNVN